MLRADRILDDDGLGFENLASLCPRLEVRDGIAEDVIACQAQAVACTAAVVVAAFAPRAGELLGRAGVSLADVPGCLVSRLCGNGVLDGEEECDDGPDNSDLDPDACRSTCLEAFCGDGVADDGEECDDGNRRDADGCDSDCVVEIGVCGNSIVEDGEDCDDGNHRDGDGCDGDCIVEVGVCGNGVIEDDEECDDGAANSDTEPDRCRTDCTVPTCGDDVVDSGHGERCEPPGTLLCTDACTLRIPILPGLRQGGRTPRSSLVSCQRAVLSAGVRAVARSRSIVSRCVQQVGRCTLGVDDVADACLGRANRRCNDAASRRDRALAKLAAVAIGGCRGPADEGPPSIDELLDDRSGLGFVAAAATCPFDGDAAPVTGDLVTCVLSQARCLGERLVAETIPLAYDFLSELDADPENRFACVVVPDDIGSTRGAFLDDR